VSGQIAAGVSGKTHTHAETHGEAGVGRSVRVLHLLLPRRRRRHRGKQEEEEVQEEEEGGGDGVVVGEEAAEPDVLLGAERDGVAGGPVAVAGGVQPARFHHRRPASHHQGLLHDQLHRRGRIRPRLQGTRRRQPQAGAVQAIRRPPAPPVAVKLLDLEGGQGHTEWLVMQSNIHHRPMRYILPISS
jgi:hypothetical protein